MADESPVDDLALFKASMQGITPLTTKRAAIKRPPPAPDPKFSRADDMNALAETLTAGPDPADLETGDDLHYRAPGVQPTVIRKMRRGLIQPEAELDLHGMNSAQANVATNQFLNTQQSLHRRCVRIIHGKGLRSPQGPVLKRKLDRWLPKRKDVLAYCSTPGNDGGTGAIYVLLRRSR